MFFWVFPLSPYVICRRFGTIPKRTCTIFKSQRKLEIYNNEDTIILLYYIYNLIDQCCITWLCLFIVLSGTNGCVNSCTNSPEDGPVGPKHVEIQQYTNKIVTSVGFHSIR